MNIMLNEKNIDNICVVKLTTEVWSDKRGIHLKKNLRFMRRLCKGFNILEEDINNSDADTVISRIINLNACKDGVYVVVTCNEYRDYESGYIEDYDYKLIPFEKDTSISKNNPTPFRLFL